MANCIPMVNQKEKRRREKISRNHARYWLGKRRSLEDRKKMGLAKLGKYVGKNSPWYGRKHTAETLEKLRLSHLGKPSPLKGIKTGRVPWNKGKRGFLSRQNHYNWQGGITPLNKKLRNSFEYKQWRESVFKRDNYTCRECGTRGVYLHADHIKPFAYFPEIRFELSNGRTLCIDCHENTDTFKGRAKQLYAHPWLADKECLTDKKVYNGY